MPQESEAEEREALIARARRLTREYLSALGWGRQQKQWIAQQYPLNPLERDERLAKADQTIQTAEENLVAFLAQLKKDLSAANRDALRTVVHEIGVRRDITLIVRRYLDSIKELLAAHGVI